MTQDGQTTPFHSHVFLGEGHDKSERKTWMVIWLCGAMMVAEIVEVCYSARLRWLPTGCT
jgi:Co/Zn/Cd efflux system component